MWVHPGRLPHILTPADYVDPERHDRELRALFAGGWHCVTTRDALRAPGDFITLELFGEPVLVRNCDGDIRAFQNVCAHRHSLLTTEARGSMAKIRCRYHGWEYDSEGRTCGVPDAPSLVPIKRGGERLLRFRAETCGQLVFVSLAELGPGLREALGERTWTVIETAFSDELRQTAAWTIDHAANWKIPVENALESYHVPQVHPKTFKNLSAARDATHTLADRFTALENIRPPGGPAMRWLTARWRRQPRHVYAHHHAFPNLLVAQTDVSSLAQIVIPLAPMRSRSLAFCFVHRGDEGRWLPRALGPVVDRVVGHFSREVLREDDAMFAGIQRGLCASRHNGVISAREERVHAFQHFVAEAVR
ncbi:MAG: aromatic ring-hydroxylating dioxygenase subunit alpha [Deltaproteobacteria bacterium]|nr:aromatic ring-hydroxylating dioxygenase subunit alpha [Deltaproteobacteria bacterium]